MSEIKCSTLIRFSLGFIVGGITYLIWVIACKIRRGKK